MTGEQPLRILVGVRWHEYTHRAEIAQVNRQAEVIFLREDTCINAFRLEIFADELRFDVVRRGVDLGPPLHHRDGTVRLTKIMIVTSVVAARAHCRAAHNALPAGGAIRVQRALPALAQFATRWTGVGVARNTLAAVFAVGGRPKGRSAH